MARNLTFTQCQNTVYYPAPGAKKPVKSPHSGGVRTSEPSEETIQIGIVRLGHIQRLRRNPSEIQETNGQKQGAKIIYIVLQTFVGLF